MFRNQTQDHQATRCLVTLTIVLIILYFALLFSFTPWTSEALTDTFWLEMSPTCSHLLWQHVDCRLFFADKLFLLFSWLNSLFESCVLVRLVTRMSLVGLAWTCAFVIWLLAVQENLSFFWNVHVIWRYSVILF